MAIIILQRNVQCGYHKKCYVAAVYSAVFSATFNAIIVPNVCLLILCILQTWQKGVSLYVYYMMVVLHLCMISISIEK